MPGEGAMGAMILLVQVFLQGRDTTAMFNGDAGKQPVCHPVRLLLFP